MTQKLLYLGVYVDNMDSTVVDQYSTEHKVVILFIRDSFAFRKELKSDSF